MIIIKNLGWPCKHHHSLLALVRLMVGFKSENQQSQKVKQLVVASLLRWKKTHQKRKKSNQATKTEESFVNALCFSQPASPLLQYHASNI